MTWKSSWCELRVEESVKVCLWVRHSSWSIYEKGRLIENCVNCHMMYHVVVPSCRLEFCHVLSRSPT